MLNRPNANVGDIMKKVVSVTLNEDGTIKGLLFEGNTRATPVKTVIRMLEEGKSVDFADSGIQVVTKKDGSKYLRSKANDTVEDNLGHMAKEVIVEKKQKNEVWEEIKAAEATNPGIMKNLRKFLTGLFR